MAYRRSLLAAALLMGVVGCGDDEEVIGASDGGTDGGAPATVMYVGPAGIGQETNPEYDGLTRDFPIATLTDAIRRRFSPGNRQYRSVDTIVLLPGEYFRNEQFPIEVQVPTGFDGFTIRGGATAVERVILRNDSVLTPVGQRNEPILRLFPGVNVETITIQNRVTAAECAAPGLFNTILIDRGEFGAAPINLRDVVISGGSRCHAHVAVGSNSIVNFEGDVVIDMGDAAGALTTQLRDLFATGAEINFTGPENRNCTGIRFENAGVDVPTVNLRGDNQVTFDQVCMRPGPTPGERVAVAMRGQASATFTGLEIQTSDGTLNGTRYTFGIRHDPSAGVSGETVLDGATIDVGGTGLLLNGGVATEAGQLANRVTDVTFENGEWGIQRLRGDLYVRNSLFEGMTRGGILITGDPVGTIDLGTSGDTSTMEAGRNIWRFQGTQGQDGDVSVDFGDDPLEEPLTIPMMGQRAWSPTLAGDVICRTVIQQEDYNVDVRTPNARVEYRTGQFCEGYAPPR